MRRCIARREDEPMHPTALVIDRNQVCYECLLAGELRYLDLVHEVKTTQEPKIGQGGGVAIIEQRRLFVGYRCSRAGCPNSQRVLEPERVYLATAVGSILKPEEE